MDDGEVLIRGSQQCRLEEQEKNPLATKILFWKTIVKLDTKYSKNVNCLLKLSCFIVIVITIVLYYQSFAVMSHSNVQKVLSCYYNLPNDSAPRQLQPSDLDPHLCTHINVAFAQIKNKTIFINKSQKKALIDIIKLKELNSHLKILLSVGGSGSDRGFPEMVINHASRKEFIKSIKYFLKKYQFDGIDLDWEFPVINSDNITLCNNRQKQHFSQLLREIKAEYRREKQNYLLTVAAAAPPNIVDVAYDVDQLNLYTDYVNIMTYDFHFYRSYTPWTGLNSPLYQRQSESFIMASLNVNHTVNMYMNLGLEPQKIVVGIPTYGHTFKLVNPNNPSIGAPASGFGELGGQGFVSYPEICKFMEIYKSNVTIKAELEAKVPYLYMNYEWVSFDSLQSVMEKAKYIKFNNLGGAMLYSLNADDHEGVCEGDMGDNKKFPLSKSVRNVLISNTNMIPKSFIKSMLTIVY